MTKQTGLLRPVLLTWRRKLPLSVRLWLATNWQARAQRHTDKAADHLGQASQLRADANQMKTDEATNGQTKP